MLGKIAAVVFYLGLALWAFGVNFPFLLIFVGVAALILAFYALQ